MSQTFKYVSPGNWSVDLGTEAIRLGSISGFVTIAELGEVGISSIVIDNPDGTVGHSSDQIVGWKLFTVDEGAEASGNQRTYMGYIQDRTYRRRADSSLITGVANEIAVNISDLNALLQLRIISDTDGNRPSETVSTRLTWLLGSDYLTGLVYDNGFVASSSVVCDKNSYVGQKPFDVLSALAIYASFNFFVYYDESQEQASLWFDNSNTSTNWDSGIFISNDLSDINQTLIENGTATIFYPYNDATLSRNPQKVYSGVYLPFAKGNVYETEPTTATAFIARDGSAPNSDVKTAAAATAIANTFLADNAEEDDRITVTIQTAAAQVNAVLAGQIVNAKFIHLPGYSDFVPMRAMRRTVMQNTMTDAIYAITYDLSPMGGGVACTYTANQLPSTDSSNDIWGAYVAPAGDYSYTGTPPTPSTTFTGGISESGTFNISPKFGINPGVFSDPQTFEARWDIDLGSATAICKAQLIATYPDPIAGASMGLDWSDDGASWTNAIATLDGTAQAVGNLSHRYWSLHYTSRTVGDPGFWYYPGVDMKGFLMWSAT